MSTAIPFRREYEFEYGAVDRLSPRIRRVVANNPGPFTFRGTGTYILGNGNIAVIDPGPDDEEHIGAILRATAGETITHILVTHTHRDHSPGCKPLQRHCAAKTYAYGPHGVRPSDDDVKVEEGFDADFAPDVRIAHGEIIADGDWSVECVHTPGHTSNHVCFQLREERALFTGDHVMAWSTSVIAPPDGNMNAYLASLRLLLDRDDAVYWPTHGPSVVEPKRHVEAFIAHRQERERQILRCLDRGLHRIEEMVPVMYADVDQRLHQAAARSVFAHIIAMVERGEIVAGGDVTLGGEYALP